jgi:hypothetical protein
MPRCCPDSMPPKIEEGRHIDVTGSGTAQDPLVLSATTDLDVQDNAVFNMILDGNGTLEAPWRLQVAYADTARLDNLPNVTVPDNTPNGYVLGYDQVNSRWVPVPPATAAPGSVSRSNGLGGDGSSGSPLIAVGDSTRFISVTAAGIGLSTTGINSLIRVFPTVAARTAASPAPGINTLSLVETDPDRLDRWDGTEWVTVSGGHNLDIKTGQLLELSGAYAGGSVTTYVKQLATVTDFNGAFEVIPADDLTDYSGVLECSVQETGTTFYHAQVAAGANNIVGFARRLGTEAAYPNASITGTVRALLY